MNVIGVDVHGVNEKNKVSKSTPVSNTQAGSGLSNKVSSGSKGSGGSGGSSGSYTNSNSTTSSTTSSTTTSETNGGSESHATETTSAVGPIDPTTQAQRSRYSGDYAPGTTVQNAYKYLQDTLAAKPGDFTSKFGTQLDDIYNKIMNRDKFTYDMNADVLYQQYKDQYMTQGKQAMEDTMGQASAMTGGYANSYAETAGQQAYQTYLGQLNDRVPELYNMAYERYRDEGEQLLNQYGLAKGRYDTDYDQYRDRVSNWQSDRSYAQSAYSDERDFDWDMWSRNREYWNDEYWKEKNAVMQTLKDAWERNWSKTISNTISNTVSNTVNNSVSGRL